MGKINDLVSRDNEALIKSAEKARKKTVKKTTKKTTKGKKK